MWTRNRDSGKFLGVKTNPMYEKTPLTPRGQEGNFNNDVRSVLQDREDTQNHLGGLSQTIHSDLSDLGCAFHT